jgi:hypothetical protein
MPPHIKKNEKFTKDHTPGCCCQLLSYVRLVELKLEWRLVEWLKW